MLLTQTDQGHQIGDVMFWLVFGALFWMLALPPIDLAFLMVAIAATATALLELAGRVAGQDR